MFSSGRELPLEVVEGRASLPPQNSAQNTTISARNRKEKLDFIDYLRGIAILMVVCVHQGQSFPDNQFIIWITSYGQMGVQLFFVASAFTLCLSSDRRRSEPGALSHFYIRRAFRIAPLYYIGIVLYFLVDLVRVHMRNDSGVSAYSLSDVSLNILFLHAFSPTAVNSVVPGGWSIGVEMAFYAIFPALLILYRAVYSRRPMIALVGVPILALLGNISGQYVVQIVTGDEIRNNSFLYFGLWNQLPVFAVGMSAYFALAGGKIVPSARRDWLGFTFFSVASVALLTSDSTVESSLLRFTLLPFISALSFLFLLSLVRGAASLPAGRIVIKLGQLSYSMYVFHFVVIFALRLLIARVSLSGMGELSIACLTLLTAIAATALIASLSKRWIEDPGISYGRALIRWHSQRRASFQAGRQ
jgi:peptidoglycan/LPS O-acetylase OafA/YrhL